ncbi:MAG: hypothetical protein D6752_05335 [Candidatus Nitrosothermus koennekii]|nr:MAG: hypothetical protein D6752_05335 [Candidatus Nitrosothermus koennekii]
MASVTYRTSRAMKISHWWLMGISFVAIIGGIIGLAIGSLYGIDVGNKFVEEEEEEGINNTTAAIEVTAEASTIVLQYALYGLLVGALAGLAFGIAFVR